jgi:putative flippase GtrA
MNRRLAAYLPLFYQLSRFGIVGLTAAAVHFCVVVYCVQMWLVAPLIANMIGFIVSFQVSYWGHRIWTFSDTTVSHRAALPKLVAVQTANFFANETLFYFFLSLGFAYPLALFFVLTILPFFTFASSKLWVFKSA